MLAIMRAFLISPVICCRLLMGRVLLIITRGAAKSLERQKGCDIDVVRTFEKESDIVYFKCGQSSGAALPDSQSGAFRRHLRLLLFLLSTGWQTLIRNESPVIQIR